MKTNSSRAKRSWTLALGLAWVCLSFTFSGCGNESARWMHAAALNEADAGNAEAAIEMLKSAIEQSEDNGQMKLSLALVYAKNEQADLGVCLCDEFLESHPENKRAYQIRSVCLQYLGRFEESFEAYQNGIDQTKEMSPATLNNLAYYQCLARKDLPRAARYIQKAIDAQTERYWGSTYPVKFRVRAAVALGLISRHVDRREIAVFQLDKLIEEFRQKWELQESLLKQAEALSEIASFQFSQNQADAIATESIEVQRTRKSLGLLIMTRCLIQEDQEMYEQVDRDRLMLQEMGFDLDELAADLPNDQACLAVLVDSSLFLDTRGFVRARLTWQSSEVQKWARRLKMNRTGLLSSYEVTLADLDLAVAGAEVFHLALYSDLVNKYDTSIYLVERQRKESLRTIAILRYHRSEAHRKAGMEHLAIEDEARIKELGLEPDASLF